jgi:hypothetical protein|tara:strand:+ start:238 stop:474 length:237 start_codon:yes stop_codon:yes gene_type:complete
MKITKTQLKQIIKEELRVTEVREVEDGSVEYHIKDAIGMLEAEEDTTGALFYVIERLYTALDTLENDPAYNSDYKDID